MRDKWLEKLTHSFVEYDSGVDMVAYGTFKGKEYRVQNSLRDTAPLIPTRCWRNQKDALVSHRTGFFHY